MNINSTYYLEITESEFQRQINDNHKSRTVNFQNIDYKKGPTYSLDMRSHAINYCKSKMAQQLKSIIVESAHFITVWSQSQNNQSTQNQNQITSQKTQESVNKIPTKTITRRYRGQTYEVEIPDYEALKRNQVQKPTQRRKYRGQYID